MSKKIIAPKPKSNFWKEVERLAKDLDERCKTDPRLKQERDNLRKQRECGATHKEWAEDRDVHGSLGFYCRKCGVWETAYSYGWFTRESFMTCSQIFAEKKK